MTVEVTLARTVDVSAPVAPQLANAAFVPLTPASPRRPGALCSRTVGVPRPYPQRLKVALHRRFHWFQLPVAAGRVGAV